MTNVQTIELLKRLGACSSASSWLGARDMATAWRECPRGDWLLWLAANLLDRKIVVRVACLCARLALPHVPAGETRPLAAIELAERWASGDETVTAHQLRCAAYFTYLGAPAHASHASHAYDACAACAAYAAYSLADDPDDTCAAYAAYAASAAKSTCADIVRQHISAEMIIDALTAAQAVTAE